MATNFNFHCVKLDERSLGNLNGVFLKDFRWFFFPLQPLSFIPSLYALPTFYNVAKIKCHSERLKFSMQRRSGGFIKFKLLLNCCFTAERTSWKGIVRFYQRCLSDELNHFHLSSRRKEVCEMLLQQLIWLHDGSDWRWTLTFSLRRRDESLWKLTSTKLSLQCKT